MGETMRGDDGGESKQRMTVVSAWTIDPVTSDPVTKTEYSRNKA
jgi:hypothetical protein